jgi:hypothetical protein
MPTDFDAFTDLSAGTPGWKFVLGAGAAGANLAWENLFADPNQTISIGRAFGAFYDERFNIVRDNNSPTYQLIRNAHSSGANAWAGYYMSASGNSWGIRMGSAATNSNHLQFDLDVLGSPNTQMILTNAWGLGLGVVPNYFPGYRTLHVKGVPSAILVVDGGSTDIGEVNASPANGVVFGSRTNSPVAFSINTAPILKIDTTGNFRPVADDARSLGIPANRWTVVYATTGAINTSDERSKRDVGEIPDQWLDAWGAVRWSRYKFLDGSRWHIGLVAQRIHAAFERHGLDAFEIGLCCFDEWNEEREPIFETVIKKRMVKRELSSETIILAPRLVDVEEEYEDLIETGEMRVVREAGDRWGLRYDECFAMEAAWQRRELTRAAEARAHLEVRLAALEAGQI